VEQAGLKNAYASITAFSKTDFPEDRTTIDVPALVLHSDDDHIVPGKQAAKQSAQLIKGVQALDSPGAPQGITATHQERVNADLRALLRS
jgi:non-heme chloroperoxidase